jgi:hypothetical protein
MAISKRRRPDPRRQAAADAVAAYLADEDADVHNITERAVREDASMAALNLTALAAAAVQALADETENHRRTYCGRSSSRRTRPPATRTVGGRSG